MARVKRGTITHKRRERVLRDTKGFRWGRKSKYRYAKDALRHAWAYAFRDRKAKKRSFRRLWQTTINTAVRAEGLRYNTFISLLKKHGIAIDRKVLSELARKEPNLLKEIIAKVKQ